MATASATPTLLWSNLRRATCTLQSGPLNESGQTHFLLPSSSNVHDPPFSHGQAIGSANGCSDAKQINNDNKSSSSGHYVIDYFINLRESQMWSFIEIGCWEVAPSGQAHFTPRGMMRQRCEQVWWAHGLVKEVLYFLLWTTANAWIN